MADRLNSRRLARRGVVKDWLLPALGAVSGLLLELLNGWRPAETLHHVLEWAETLSKSVNLWPGRKVAMAAADWVSGPVVGFWLGMIVTKPARRLMDQIPGLRDPPPFVRVDLDAEENRPFAGTGWIKPAFIGREDDLAELVGWAAAPAPGRPFAWRGLIGRSGIGKTRLAIQWLAVMDRRGWDAGVVDPDHPIPVGWRARRPTALVVDEALLFWDGRLSKALDALCAGSSDAHPLRVLVLNPMEPALEWRDSVTSRLVEASRATSLRLAALRSGASETLWREVTKSKPELADVTTDAAGLPLAIIRTGHGALEGRPASYLPELRANAVKLMPVLDDHRGREATEADWRRLKLLVFSALAGPIDNAAARHALGDIGRFDLSMVLPDADLDKGIPLIAPEDLKLELLLRALAVLGEDLGGSTVRLASEANPGAVESTLGAAWATRPEAAAAGRRLGGSSVDTQNPAGERAARLAQAQMVFDDLQPERVSRLRRRAEALVGLTAMPDLPTADLEKIEADLDDLVDRRPFDPAIRLKEAEAANNAIGRYGMAGEWAALERWGDRLQALARTEPFDRDPAIRLEEADAAFNAITAHGTAEEWVALERWGDRLQALARTEPFDRDPAIRLREAEAAFNAITGYGRAGEWVALERWGDRLQALARTEPFDRDPAIRLEEAEAAFNAITAYGRDSGRFGEQRRRWFVRLARCARWFPTDGPIQAIARNAGVSIVEQEACGWPYGRDQGTARTGPSTAPIPPA